MGSDINQSETSLRTIERKMTERDGGNPSRLSAWGPLVVVVCKNAHECVCSWRQASAGTWKRSSLQATANVSVCRQGVDVC